MTQTAETLPSAPDRHTAGGYPHPPARGAGKIRLRSERVPDAGVSARRVSRLLCLSRRADGEGRRPDQGRARNDRGRHLQRQPVPVLRDRAWRDPADPGQEPADRRPDRRQLPQGGYHAAPARHARLRHEGQPARRARSPNRISPISPATASATTTSGTSPRSRRSLRCRTGWPTSPAMRPNDEFYLMGRLPK